MNDRLNLFSNVASKASPEDDANPANTMLTPLEEDSNVIQAGANGRSSTWIRAAP